MALNKREIADRITGKPTSPISKNMMRFNFVEGQGLYFDFRKTHFGSLPKFPETKSLPNNYELDPVTEADYLKGCFEYIQMWPQTKNGFLYIKREKENAKWFIKKKFWSLRDKLFVYYAIPYKYFIKNFVSLEEIMLRILSELNMIGYYPQRKGFVPICNSCNYLIFPSKLSNMCHICGNFFE